MHLQGKTIPISSTGFDGAFLKCNVNCVKTSSKIQTFVKLGAIRLSLISTLSFVYILTVLYSFQFYESCELL